MLSESVRREIDAFRFLDLPTTQKIARRLGFLHRYIVSRSVRQEISNALRFFEGSRGDILVVNTQKCLHGAGVPDRGFYRDVIQFEIYPSKTSDFSKLFDSVRDDSKELSVIFAT